MAHELVPHVGDDAFINMLGYLYLILEVACSWYLVIVHHDLYNAVDPTQK